MYNPAREVPNIKSFLRSKDGAQLTPDDLQFISKIKNQNLNKFCIPSIDDVSECIINNKLYQAEMEKYNTMYYIIPHIGKQCTPEAQKAMIPRNKDETYYPAKLSTDLFRACNTLMFEKCKKIMAEKNFVQYFRE